MTPPTTRSYKIATIPGDGIGREVVPEGIRVAEAAARRFGFSLSWKEFDWSCERYLKTGRMMPEDGLEQLRPFDAIFLGAVGHPERGRSRFALGPADSDPPRLPAVRKHPAGAPASRHRACREEFRSGPDRFLRRARK